MPMTSCVLCAKTIITDDKGKILVGCPHHPVVDSKYDMPDFMQSIFNQK